VAAGDAEEKLLKKSDLDKKNMLMFCHKHGITCNKETIWRLVKRHDLAVANARRLCVLQSLSSTGPEQLSLNLKPVSTWLYKG